MNTHGFVGRAALDKLAKEACALVAKQRGTKLDAVKVREAIESDMAQNGFVITSEQISQIVDGKDLQDWMPICFGCLAHALKGTHS